MSYKKQQTKATYFTDINTASVQNIAHIQPYIYHTNVQMLLQQLIQNLRWLYYVICLRISML